MDARHLTHDRLRAAWAAYEAAHLPSLAHKTQLEYRAAWARVLADLPDPWGTPDVYAWQRGGLARYSHPYRVFLLAVLRTVSRRAAYATGDEELRAAVWRVGQLRPPPRASRCPPRDLMRRSLTACRSRAERLWVELAGFGGLRVGELLGLRPSDWDADAGVLRVERQRESEHRKNRRPHTLRLDDRWVVGDLEWTLEHHDELRSRQGRHRGRCAPCLFPWGAKRVEAFLRHLRESLPEGYLPRGLAWHAYRHWGATELARRGASAWDVQAWLGDSSTGVAVGYVDMVRGQTAARVGLLARGSRLYPAPARREATEKRRAAK